MNELEKKILFQIEKNRLSDLDYDFLIRQLSVLNNLPYEEIKVAVDNLISKKQIKSVKLETVENLSREENIQEANEILEYKDKKSQRKSNRLEGTICGTSKGYAFLCPLDKSLDDVFIAERNLNGAVNNDRVVIAISRFGGKSEGKVLQILERGNDQIVGKIQMSKKCAYVVPDDVKFGKDVYVPINKVLGANNGDKVVVKIERFFSGKKNPEGVVTEVLGAPDEISTEVMSIIRSYKLYETFPKKVSESATFLPTEIDPNGIKGRLDLRDQIIFTIDGEDTRDIDDAISLTINNNGNRELGVHIADVGEYVRYKNIFDQEAFKRGTSVYFPDLVLPMLPRELSNGICSLNEGVDRFALSVFIEYDQNANVVNSKICESVIKSKKRYTYTEISKIFDNDTETINNNKAFVETITKMRELAKQLMEKRINAGYLEFNIPEVQVATNNLGEVIDLQKREQDESHKLIEAFMVAANEAVATKFLSMKAPFVYRVHENPDSEKLIAFQNLLQTFGIELKGDKVSPKQLQNVLKQAKGQDCEYVVNKVCLRSMKKAQYSPDCLGHFGLALQKYCHFTSPIRRYPDLTIHRIIKMYLHNELTGKNLFEMKEFVDLSSNNSSVTERNAEKAERDVDDLYRAFYMSKKVGQDFEGIISSVTAWGVFVELENTVEGLVRLEDLPTDNYQYIEEKFAIIGAHHTFKLGQKVKVKVLSVDKLAREVNFMLI